MNKRQQKEYDKISKFLEQFGAKFKDSIDYEHSEKNITIINKYNVEKIVLPGNCLKLKANNKYWTFDGVMCDRERKELQIIKEIAESKGGKLISTEYINTHAKLEFEDSAGRRFFMAATDVKGKNGRWSGYESGNVYNNPEYHFNEIKKIAESKGGKVISKNYISARTKMEFENIFGGRFFCTPNQIKRGVWSHFEVINISEERCRQCIEFIFEQDFPNVWGIVKNSKTKRGLQFDGYNEKLNMAFEYQGEQHYSWEQCRGTTEEKIKNI